jgi:oligopeptide/dipeptide ABC transporter ATP-binding protein
MTDRMIEVTGLKKYFQIKQFLKKPSYVHAVDNVDFFIDKGQTLGIAGESGCGKTTLARCTLQLIKPDAGSIKFDGKLMGSKRRDLKEFRRRTALVFQDPSSSLDPRMTIADVVGEPLAINGMAHGEEREARILELLKSVGLELDHMYRYPHEFSGGQKQRIAIARALAVNPSLVLLDEPTSALDVSVQAQVLNLLDNLQKNLGLTYMLISHDLNTVRHISHRIAIMYLGKIVEYGSDTAVFESAMHPYTRALLSANPLPDPTVKKARIILKGDVPSPINPPSGCRFHPRCPSRMPICEKEDPKYLEVEKEHFVACHLYD